MRIYNSLLILSFITSSSFTDQFKTIFEEIEIEKGFEELKTMTSPDSHIMQYFIRLYFYNDKKALYHLLSAEDSNLFDCIYTFNVYFIFNIHLTPQQLSVKYEKMARKVFEGFEKNKFKIRKKRSLKDVVHLNELCRNLEDVIDLAHQGDKKAAKYFYNLVDNLAIDAKNYLDLIRKMAERGDTKAMCLMGDAYLYGHGVEECPDTAIHYYIKGAEKRDYRCINGVGKAHLRKKNTELALKYFKTASAAGIGEAEYNVFKIYSENYQNQELGQAFLNNSATRGYIPALYQFSKMQFKNNNFKTANTYFSGVCDNIIDIIEIMNEASELYLQEKYLQCFIRYVFCAQAGISEALQNIIFMIKNKRKELLEFEKYKSLNQIYYESAHLLINMGISTHIIEHGDCYYYGLGVEKSYENAFSSYLCSSLNKSQEGHYCVAYCYLNGLGKSRDFKKSYEFISQITTKSKNAYILIGYFYIYLILKIITYYATSSAGLIAITIILANLGLFYFLRKRNKTETTIKEE